MPERIETAADSLWMAVLESLSGSIISDPTSGERPGVELKTVTVRPFSTRDWDHARTNDEDYKQGLHVDATASVKIRRQV
jgi:hypothetical protein